MRSVLLLLSILFASTALVGQDLKVRISLKEGTVAEGKLLKMNVEGVEINPGGAVKWRFIPAERIRSVEIVELNRTIEYPLVEGSLPPELEVYDAGSAAQQEGFPRFVAAGSFGYTAVGGKYYEGLNAGTAFRLGVHYYFPDPDPSASRFFLGFSYNHSSVKGDKILGLDPTLVLNEYSLEIGRTTRLFGGGHYLYLLMGGVIVSNEISLPMQSLNVSYSETKAALRMEGDASIGVGGRFSLLIAVGYDIVWGTTASNSYNTNVYSTYNPNSSITFAGGIFYASLGLTYGL